MVIESKLEGDDVLVVRMKLNKAPAPSKSANPKLLMCGSSGGFAPTTIQFLGKPLKISVNAGIPI